MILTNQPTPGTRTVTVLGMFDGVHRGHQALLMKGRELADELGAQLAVCTFEPHPLSVLRPELQPDRLTTQAERAQLMSGYGVDLLCVKRFTREMAAQDPTEFLRELARDFSPAAVVCGFNFTFGDRGRGNAQLLCGLQEELGYQAHIVPEVTLRGGTVSSTRIRGLLQQGEIREAAMLLGHAYTIAAPCEVTGYAHGCALIRMNAQHRKALPAPGDYDAYLTVNGRSFEAMARFGTGRAVTVCVRDDASLQEAGMARLTLMDVWRGGES